MTTSNQPNGLATSALAAQFSLYGRGGLLYLPYMAMPGDLSVYISTTLLSNLFVVQSRSKYFTCHANLVAVKGKYLHAAADTTVLFHQPTNKTWPPQKAPSIALSLHSPLHSTPVPTSAPSSAVAFLLPAYLHHVPQTPVPSTL